VTEGAIKGSHDFTVGGGDVDSWTVSPDLSWNHNTIATTPTDNWNVGSNLVHRFVYSDRLERVDFDASLKWQEDLAKSANSVPVKLDATWYTKWLESVPWDDRRNWSVRPTVSIFWQDVYSAQANKKTGVAPTGVLSGEMVVLNFAARIDRFSFTASSQDQQATHAVAGQATGAHHLTSISLNYDFFDQPQKKSEKAASFWQPGISISRQVGDDPFGAVARTGFTAIALSIKY
jgi:hypothetical protein